MGAALGAHPLLGAPSFAKQRVRVFWETTVRCDLSKNDIIAAIRKCARKLGRPPSLLEFKRATKLTQRAIGKHFATYSRALTECGMERRGSGHPVPLSALFTDWARIVRKLGKLPTVAEYQIHSRYSIQPLYTRFRSWKQVPLGLLLFAEENGSESKWSDVLNKVRECAQKECAPGPACRPPRRLKQTQTSPVWHSRPGLCEGDPGPHHARILPHRPTYGPWLATAPLAHGPVNEAGVVCLFGMLAAQLGFVVLRIQTEFPDCEAMRQVGTDRWQRVRIEFEFESRNFLKHLHSAEDCDLIVCWAHNWPDSPLEVLELRRALAAG